MLKEYNSWYRQMVYDAYDKLIAMDKYINYVAMAATTMATATSMATSAFCFVFLLEEYKRTKYNKLNRVIVYANAPFFPSFLLSRLPVLPSLPLFSSLPPLFSFSFP